VNDLEASSYRVRGHLRQLVRLRWLAIGIAAALIYFAHTALDVLVPLAPLFKESGRGNGSGVLIACAAVERFGGTIHFSDRRGGGTRVQIELPLFRPRAATTGEDDDYRRLGIA